MRMTMNNPTSNEPTIQQLFDLSGKVVLITGGTGFLGSAMSRALAEAGATVVISSREVERARTAVEKLPKGKANHHAVQLDHMNPESLEHGFRAAVKAAGQVDVLVNNGHDPLGAD